MQQSLLEKVRRINRIVQSKNQGYIDFSKLCSVLGDAIDSNIYLIDRKGQIISKYLTPFVIKDINISQNDRVLEKVQNFFWSLIDTRPNLRLIEILKLTEIEDGKNTQIDDTFCCVTPIVAGDKRLGTIFSIKSKNEFTENDILLIEYASTIAGLEFLNMLNEENEEERKKKVMIHSAIETLSMSELEAIINVFNELKGNEGLLVASKIADRIGITRSVIVNALRKFESAGLIETRSLGLKGTYIKVINDMLRTELIRYRENIKKM